MTVATVGEQCSPQTLHRSGTVNVIHWQRWCRHVSLPVLCLESDTRAGTHAVRLAPSTGIGHLFFRNARSCSARQISETYEPGVSRASTISVSSRAVSISVVQVAPAVRRCSSSQTLQLRSRRSVASR
jgi:hypothetical protein